MRLPLTLATVAFSVAGCMAHDTRTLTGLATCQRRRKNRPLGRRKNQPLVGIDAQARRSPGMGFSFSGFGCFDPARLALSEAVGGGVHLEDVNVMGQPVEERAGQALVAEGGGPLVEGRPKGAGAASVCEL